MKRCIEMVSQVELLRVSQMWNTVWGVRVDASVVLEALEENDENGVKSSSAKSRCRTLGIENNKSLTIE